MNALAELLAGKAPETMCDALHAGRYLSAEGLRSPARMLELMKTALRSSRPRPLLPATQMERLAATLARSGFLNQEGQRLAAEETAEE
jgi:hypothetical protein